MTGEAFQEAFDKVDRNYGYRETEDGHTQSNGQDYIVEVTQLLLQ